MLNSVALAEANEGMQGIAGWLALSVPTLSRIIITGSLDGFVHMANYMASTLQGTASSVGQEMSSGNISLGNLSYDNASMHNLSANKFDDNISHMSGQRIENLPDGTLKTTNPAGNVVFRGGVGYNMSSLGLQIGAQSNLASQLSQSAGQEQQLASQEGTSLSHSFSQAKRSAADLVTRLSLGENYGENFSLEKASSQNQAVSQTLDFARSLKSDYGLSDQKAVEMALTASAGQSLQGGALSLLAPSAQVTQRGSASSHLSHSELQDSAQRHNFTTTFDDVVRGLQSETHSRHVGRESQAADNISRHWDETKTHGAQQEAHLRQAKTLSQNASLIQSSSLNVGEDLGQGFLEFMSKKPMGLGNQPMGMDKAYKIASAKDGALLQTRGEFIQDFSKQYQESAVSYFKNHELQDASQLQQAFGEIKGQMSAERPNKDELNAFRGVAQSVVVPSQLEVGTREKVKSLRSENLGSMVEQAEYMDLQSQKQQAELQNEKEKFLIPKAAKNLLIVSPPSSKEP